MTDELLRKTENLIENIKKYNPRADIPMISKAMKFAYAVHHGKKRPSGEDYFEHCYNVANLAIEFKMDSHSIAAALLHNVIEDGGVKPETVEREFDKELLILIHSLSRLKKVDKNVSFEEEKERRAENLRKIMLASSKDVRVIIIKVLDRLASMRTLKNIPENIRKLISEETMNIYAPIAHKLGMYSVKAELEDWSFRFMEPKKYSDIKVKISKKRDQRHKEISKIINFVKSELGKENIEAEISGRAKHFYSIYKKIISENKKFDEIYDLMAIRIIVNTVNECYTVLGIIHKLWKPMPPRFKDYIAVPKDNGYQSLHTGVFIGEGKVLEVQIRTKDMHNASEQGIAAHWRYKGDERDKKFDRQIEWMKQILDWKRYSSDAGEFIESMKVDLFEKAIFVFTPKGDPIELPEDATTIDFAYAVHTDIGDHCRQAKVNGVVVPLDHKLSSGDVVEIITAKNAVPSRSWLSFVRSMHTRIKIRNALKMHVDTKRKKNDEDREESDIEDEIIYQGKKFTLKIPKCCMPKKSDSIRAFKTKEGKIVMHKSGCPNVYTCDLTKEVQLTFEKPSVTIEILRVDVIDRVGILSEILSIIAQEHYNVQSVNTRPGRDGRIIITCDILNIKKEILNALILRIRKIPSVLNAFIEKS